MTTSHMIHLIFSLSPPEKMFAKALEYKEVHGSTDIPEGEKGAILLRRWLNHQCLEHHNFDSLSSQQIEKLELELGHILPPSWEDMYDRLVVHRELSGIYYVLHFTLFGVNMLMHKVQSLCIVTHKI